MIITRFDKKKYSLFYCYQLVHIFDWIWVYFESLIKQPSKQMSSINSFCFLPNKSFYLIFLFYWAIFIYIEDLSPFTYIFHKNCRRLSITNMTHTGSAKYLSFFFGKCFTKKLLNIFSNFFFYLKVQSLRFLHT